MNPSDMTAEQVADAFEESIAKYGGVAGPALLRRAVELLRRKVVDLADDVRQDEPVGYLVFDHTGEYDYRYFGDLRYAKEFAESCCEEGEQAESIYPLYAGKAVSE